MTRFFHIGFVCIVFFVAGIKSVFAQLVTIDATLDTNEILIGDKVNFRLEAVKPKDAVLRFPVLGKELGMGVEVTDSSKVDSTRQGKKQVKLWQDIELMVFDTGLFYIPPLDFVLYTENHTDTLQSVSNYLEVHGVAIDTTGTIRDIKGIEKAPFGFGNVFLYLLLAGFILSGIYVWYYFSRWKPSEGPGSVLARPAEPPHIVALRELDKLKAEKLWQQGEYKPYYTRLTSIIRIYIEHKFFIKALEQTTEEILHDIRKSPFAELNYEMLKSLLNLADLVKFAKGVPEPEENMEHMENAYTFINNTKDMGSETDDEETNSETDKKLEA